MNLRSRLARLTPRSRRIIRELLAWLAVVLLVGTFVVLFQRLGWLGLGLSWAMLTGSLLLFLVGLPTGLTEDISLPKDTRERLEWEASKPHIYKGKPNP